jgi:HSP20 family protein
VAALEHLGDELRSAWHSVTEGWRQLSRRAGRALTRFRPGGEPQWPAAGAEWGFLAADAYDEEDRIMIKLEAPGLEKEDFDLSITDDALLVRGEKRFERGSFRPFGLGHSCEFPCRQRPAMAADDVCR